MIDIEEAKKLDRQDPLAKFRERFLNRDHEIYLDGNSLGKLPLAAIPVLEETISNQWGKQLIRSWNKNWLELPKRLSRKYCELLNADEGELIFGESTSVRIYQIIFALLESNIYPKKILTDALNFPTDLYVLQGLAKHFSIPDVQVLHYDQEIEANLDRLKDAIRKSPGIVCLSLVTYKSSYLYPIKELNHWAAAHKSIIIWDLSHAVGALEIDFKTTETLVALGCTYKYMNGGPGSPAFLYVHKKLQDNLQNPIQGWFGHQHPFAFETKYKAAKGLERFNNGTPPILSMQATETGIDLILEAGIKMLREKSVLQSEFLINLVKNELRPLNFELQSPEDVLFRGSHLTLSHKAAWQICQALIKGDGDSPKIIPDYRPPHFIRLGIAPLYTRFEDLWRTVYQLKKIVISESYLNYSAQKENVT